MTQIYRVPEQSIFIQLFRLVMEPEDTLLPPNNTLQDPSLSQFSSVHILWTHLRYTHFNYIFVSKRLSFC